MEVQGTSRSVDSWGYEESDEPREGVEVLNPFLSTYLAQCLSSIGSSLVSFYNKLVTWYVKCFSTFCELLQ